MARSRPFIVDGHLDLATNAMAYNRDLTQPVYRIRQRERELNLADHPDRGRGTVALPELRKGRVGLVLATLIARYTPPGAGAQTVRLPGWHSAAQAWADAQGQLAWYREMEAQGEMVPIVSATGLEDHLAHWARDTEDASKPIGYVLALEGADSIVNLDYLHRYYQQGLRSIGPAHFGPGRYAAGTGLDGSGLTPEGRELLKEMADLKMLLDLTHLTDRGFFEALEIYEGPVAASHQNCRALVAGERQFSDDQIRAVIERGGLLGGALDAWMLHPGYERGRDNSQELNILLERVVDHFDHVCQLAGNCNHVGIGSDLDGLFGREQSPADLDTVADLQRLEELLEGRGYGAAEREQVLSGNWLRVIRRVVGSSDH
ncbi:membrane dipeptidase [Lewinella marina]|uniref:Peptidase M19 n=1 Tax=Neolewinella marina TaxID=438751 RepID=A0A2G0CC98_9BACT|nr:membrane dipeptidase [Neolewinella marina]NJB87702.1 membrane dipeptidase [Neolewinella marina]PHK97619.1 peptidase M19 [Neolewinella marina]